MSTPGATNLVSTLGDAENEETVGVLVTRGPGRRWDDHWGDYR